MSSETFAAVLWLVVNLAGLVVAVRATFRGLGRLKVSEGPVARGVHLAEFFTGALFTCAFLVSASAAVTSLYILPVAPDVSEYAVRRATVLRYMLFAEKFFYIVVCLIPEVLDRYLTSYARRIGP